MIQSAPSRSRHRPAGIRAAMPISTRSGFQNPPPGYGEVPFWWWTGDPLDVERLTWQLEQLHQKGISGVQVNYAHEDSPGWPTYAAEPPIFSEPGGASGAASPTSAANAGWASA